VDQELIRNLLYTEAKALNFSQYLEQDPQFIQMKRYHILSNAFRILVREATQITTEDARAYYEENIDSYSTPASRDIQVLWFTDMDVANRTWSLFNLANRIRNENRMTELINRYSTQPARNELPNQYNNGTVTGVGPDAEFSRLIWSTDVNAVSPVFTTATGEIVFFRVLREKPVSATPFVEVEPRIQGAIRQTKERAKQDEMIQTLSTEYHLRKYPERITLLLSADDLFELANTAAQQRNYNDAITYYDQIIGSYKNNIDGYKASFMKAFLISEEMNNKPRALELFRQFIAGFPQGDLHESAQFMIDVLEGNVDPLPMIEE
jgi:tetratricopeptide (TPR) repeat protein